MNELLDEEHTIELEAHGDTLQEIALRLSIKFWRSAGGDFFDHQGPRLQTKTVIETAADFYLFLKDGTG